MCNVLRITIHKSGFHASTVVVDTPARRGGGGTIDIDRDIGKPPRVTIKTVARDAGVSVAAVSKVLNNAYGVSAEMRTKVTRSVDRLGYRPSFAARGMRGQTDTIGVLLIDMRNPFLADVTEGIKEGLDAIGKRMMISFGGAETVIEKSLIDAMIDMRMDGVIMVAPRLPSAELAAYARQVPTVLIGHHEPAATAFDTINSDDRLGATLAVRRLVGRGFRDIWMLAPPRRSGGHEVGDIREEGYLAAMGEAGLADRARVIVSRNHAGEDEDELRALLDAIPRPGAVFAWSDIHGIPLVALARERGLSVPGDFAVVGYDDSTLAASRSVRLSSIDQRGHEIGRRAAGTIVDRVAGGSDGRHVLIPPRFVGRASG